MVDRQPGLRGHQWIDRGDAGLECCSTAMYYFTILNELWRNEFDAIRGHGETDAIGGRFKFGGYCDQGWNTNQVGIQADQRAAAVARGYRRLGLYGIHNGAAPPPLTYDAT